MAQTTLNYLQNRNLFSTHYLESLINDNPEWGEDVTDAFNRAKKLYDGRKESWNRMDESMLEEFLIRPLLKEVLGHHFVPQAKVDKSGRRPDYAFFESDAVLNEALEKKGVDDIYLKAVAVGDAKSWKTSLDKKVRGVGGSFEFQNPSFQIDYYLRDTPVQWGILTNGHHWRLYHKETSYKLDSYYEIDLVTILETNDIEGFKYFYLFFRLNAFIKDASGKNFLERVKDESTAYATKLRENLQQNVYKAMKILAEGFFEWKDNALVKNEHDLKKVQENTLKLLYRLLFIFYAESLRLLDRDNAEYKKLGLESIKNDIANRIDNREFILPVTTNYWNKLDTLFALINEGSESERFHISKAILDIPAYNGGLFDPERNPFLHNKKVGDEYMAKAIDFLAREEKDFIDYSTLGTRQLGSIYEGLLEYKLKVSEEDLVAIKEKGHERWIPKKDAEGKKTFDEIKAGAIYLVTDKGERKATGSYYTPDYIVKYIVRNTLEPILDEKRVAWKEKGLGERPFLHDILSIRVLDPAMGSGHFLVEACEFLANRLVEAWGEARPEELESEEVAEHDVHWARREVVRHCIFGVDLNPMAVELAKLSLWLETVAANKPLTFLDHHLKVGNSLIGAQVKELKMLPSKEKKEGAENGKKQLKAPTLWDFTVKKHFEELLVKYGEFAAHPDDDLKSVKQKEQEYDALQKSELNRRLHELANIWVSTYFGAAPSPDEYAEMQNEMNPKEFSDWGKWRGRAWFAEAQRLAGEKRFFHWELEFPESFYEKGAPKENPGWDAVVGNPPYGALLDENDRTYLGLNYETAAGYKNTGLQFIERSDLLLMKKGACGLIVPKSLTYSQGWNKGVELILPRLNYLIDASKAFEDVLLEQVVIVFSENQTNPDFYKSSFFHQSEVAKYVLIPKNSYSLCGTLITFITFKEFEIFNKMNLQNHYFKNISTTFRGVPWQKYLSSTGTTRILRGDHIERFRIIDSYDFIDLDKISVPKSKIELLKQPKIISQNIVAHVVKPVPHIIIMSALDKNGLLNLDTVNNTVLTNNDYALEYLLCILNCNLTSWYTYRFIYNQAIRTMHFDDSYVGKIPIRRISFTTPPTRRAALVVEAKALYSEFCSGMANSDRINRMDRINSTTNPVAPVHPVQTGASFSAAPDSGLPAFKCGVIDFVGARLEAKPEESDVVHDLLAHLAERMIEMNKEKNAEIKGFLRWLEGEIGAPVEELANKTALKEYYEQGFETFAGALVKNKKKLKEGYDPTRREPKEKLEKEFSASVEKLAPRLKRIEATDMLIDHIVYRLYGLTEDEIKIVKESLSSHKDSNTKENERANKLAKSENKFEMHVEIMESQK